MVAGLGALAASLVVLGTSGGPAGADPPSFSQVVVAPAALADPGVLLTPSRNAPDPFVLKVAGAYFMFGSQAQFLGANVPVMVSSSLDTWGATTLDALPQLPVWATPGFTWSPDVRKLGGRYVMWFNASVVGMGFAKCIGVATSSSVIGPYVSTQPTPLVCQLDHLGSIDPRTFVDPEGRLWLLWKSDDNADLNASTHSTIYVQQLTADGTHLLGSPVALLTADLPWEGRIVEAPDMVFAGGRYWLFFSGNWFNQPGYGIGVAQCAGPTGPCEPATYGPWFGSNAQGLGPGEESLFFDGSRWWMLYAPFAVNDQDPSLPRPAAMVRLTFGPAGPTVVAPGSAAWDQPDPAPPSQPHVQAAVPCTGRPFEARCLARASVSSISSTGGPSRRVPPQLPRRSAPASRAGQGLSHYQW